MNITYLSTNNAHQDPPPDPPDPPEGVMVDVESTSVRVSWQTVEDADRYTVTFTRATGDDQEGDCPPDSPHSITVSVDAPAINTSINRRQDTVSNERVLEDFCTYIITVVAVNELRGSSNTSEEFRITLQSTGIK